MLKAELSVGLWPDGADGCGTALRAHSSRHLHVHRMETTEDRANARIPRLTFNPQLELCSKSKNAY